jgi:hypothetical protein
MKTLLDKLGEAMLGHLDFEIWYAQMIEKKWITVLEDAINDSMRPWWIPKCIWRRLR